MYIYHLNVDLYALLISLLCEVRLALAAGPVQHIELITGIEQLEN